MSTHDNATIELMRGVLNEAWSSLSSMQQKHIFQSDMASRILHEASNGERDPIKLREAALDVDRSGA